MIEYKRNDFQHAHIVFRPERTYHGVQERFEIGVITQRMTYDCRSVLFLHGNGKLPVDIL